MQTDFEKLLRAYIRYVTERSGTSYLAGFERDGLISEGLSGEEVDALLRLGDDEWTKARQWPEHQA